MVRWPATGKYRRTRLFVLTLACSRKAVRLLTWRSSAQIWCELHERAFRRLGGTTKIVVLDNLKEGVLTPDIYDPALNPLYRHAGALRRGNSCASICARRAAGIASMSVICRPARPRPSSRCWAVRRRPARPSASSVAISTRTVVRNRAAVVHVHQAVDKIPDGTHFAQMFRDVNVADDETISEAERAIRYGEHASARDGD